MTTKLQRNDQNTPLSGKTYTLYGNESTTEDYYNTIKELADLFLKKCPDENVLLSHVQRAGGYKSPGRKVSGKECNRSLATILKKTLRDTLSVYTSGVDLHLRNLPLSQRFDSIIKTKKDQYHLYMLEIELVNRIYKEAFKNSNYKFALLPHCLRDFRPDCCAEPGEIEQICQGCTEACFINLGSILLKQYDINPYISVEMDQEKLFKKLKRNHPSISALGIACIPELVRGMRLCIQLNIPPVGIPLDANRCARWNKKALESSFNLKELEELLQ